MKNNMDMIWVMSLFFYKIDVKISHFPSDGVLSKAQYYQRDKLDFY